MTRKQTVFLAPLMVLTLILFVQPCLAKKYGPGPLTGQALSARKHFKNGVNSLKQGQHYLAACSMLDSLHIKNKPKRFKKLTPIVKDAYDEKLRICEGFLRGENFRDALTHYKHFKLFLIFLERYQMLNFVTIDIEKKIAEASMGVAADAYKAAEVSFGSGAWSQAIDKYRVVLAHAPNFKDTREKIAECLYSLGKNELLENRFRKAAAYFADANGEVSDYKDAMVHAAEIYYQLGNHAFDSEFYRQAWLEYKAVTDLDPEYKDAAIKQQSAMEAAEVILGFGQFDNKTGFSVSGMAVGDFIFQELRTKLEGKGSQFFKLTFDMEKSDFIANGAVTQVLANEKETPPVEKVEIIKWKDYEKYKDANGKKHTREIPRSETVRYLESSKSRQVVFSGYMNVRNKTTDDVVINKQISKSDTQAAHWAELITQTENQWRLSERVKALLAGSRTIRSEDSMIKTVISHITDELVVVILEELDKTQKVQEPTSLQLDLI